jgi:MCM10 OB-fold/Primase zinc finger
MAHRSAASSRIQTKIGASINDVCGIDVRDPRVTAPDLVDKLKSSQLVFLKHLSKMHNFTKLESANWVTFGVVYTVSEPKKTKRGKPYQVWRVGDLYRNEATVMLFDDAQATLWKLVPGAVVCIANPSILPDQKSNSRVGLSVDTSTQVLHLGHSKGFGFCEGTAKSTGLRCTSVVDRTKQSHCTFHLSAKFKKMMEKRPELNREGSGVTRMAGLNYFHSSSVPRAVAPRFKGSVPVVTNVHAALAEHTAQRSATSATYRQRAGASSNTIKVTKTTKTTKSSTEELKSKLKSQGVKSIGRWHTKISQQRKRQQLTQDNKSLTHEQRVGDVTRKAQELQLQRAQFHENKRKAQQRKERLAAAAISIPDMPDSARESAEKRRALAAQAKKKSARQRAADVLRNSKNKGARIGLDPNSSRGRLHDANATSAEQLRAHKLKQKRLQQALQRANMKKPSGMAARAAAHSAGIDTDTTDASATPKKNTADKQDIIARTLSGDIVAEEDANLGHSVPACFAIGDRSIYPKHKSHQSSSLASLSASSQNAAANLTSRGKSSRQARSSHRTGGSAAGAPKSSSRMASFGGVDLQSAAGMALLRAKSRHAEKAVSVRIVAVLYICLILVLL